MSVRSDKEYTVTYDAQRGVDLGAMPDGAHFARLENMYRDYEMGGALTSIPGFRRLVRLGGRINGIFSHTGADKKLYTVVHAGDALYRFAPSDGESLVPPEPLCNIENTRSAAFTYRDGLFILDGKRITVIDRYGRCTRLCDDNSRAYIPTTYKNGERWEQINLLTEEFREETEIGLGAEYAPATAGLRYTVTDGTARLCAVVGISADFTGGEVYIPAYTDIGGVRYRVTEVADGALAGRSLTSLTVCEGVLRIGHSACIGCLSLKSVYTPLSLVEIGEAAFEGCGALTTLYLSSGVQRIGASAFAGCDALKSVNYGSGTVSLSSIDGYEELEGMTVSYGVRAFPAAVRIPIHTPCREVSEVWLDGERLTDYGVEERDGLMLAVTVSRSGIGEFDGRRIELLGMMDTAWVKVSDGTRGLLNPTLICSGYEAVAGCTGAVQFDGRIFLYGNPSLKNTVIYTEYDDTGAPSPYYFGNYNYFEDGDGESRIVAAVPSDDALITFTDGAGAEGSVFYHTPREGVGMISRLYPVTRRHTGEVGAYRAISFADEPTYITRDGLYSLTPHALGTERCITERSGAIGARLSMLDLSRASLTSWCGYICVGVGSEIFLGDSRKYRRDAKGEYGYEWYPLTGIGSYTGDVRVYKYTDVVHEGFDRHPHPDSRVPTEYEINIGTAKNGERVYYVTADGYSYEVYPTEEHTGGILHPMTELYSPDGELLFFGCENGDLCLFNNDRRGVAPTYLTRRPDYDPAEYAAAYGDRLHPYFYDFNSHGVRYLIKTPMDRCGVPTEKKDTVKGSMTLTVQTEGQDGDIDVEVLTDRKVYREEVGLRGSMPDFADLDFSTLSFSGMRDTAIPLGERVRGWLEKEICVSVNAFRTPLTLYSLSYRFKIKGR